MMKLLPFFCLVALCRSQTEEVGGDLDAIIAQINGNEVSEATETYVTETTEFASSDVVFRDTDDSRRKREANIENCTTKQGEAGKCVEYNNCRSKVELTGAKKSSFGEKSGCTSEKYICCALKQIASSLHGSYKGSKTRA